MHPQAGQGALEGGTGIIENTAVIRSVSYHGVIEAKEEIRRGGRDSLAEARQVKAIKIWPVNSTRVGRKVLYYCWFIVVITIVIIITIII